VKANDNDKRHAGKTRARAAAGRVARELSSPGVGIEQTSHAFGINPLVFVVACASIFAVIVWAVVSPSFIAKAGDASLAWVTTNFGWLFGLLAITTLVFMLVIGYGRCGGVRLGADDEEPEFSTFSWIAMLFSAGMGIGLLFYGPYEPLVYFNHPPHGFDVAPHTVDAAQAAMAQTILHWGPIPWALYALVGGAIAYSAYRRGRAPLISAIFEPLFGRHANGVAGAVVDIFAIVVTLFGTAVSLGIGALQIGKGIEITTGSGPLGEHAMLAIVGALTLAFAIPAMSGIKRGIRLLSNANMAIAGCLALFVCVVGPSLFLLNFFPAAILSFLQDFATMLIRNPNQGEEVATFMASWTTYYWAWWISWTPFVGMFIARISRGRTLREFVTVVIVVPAFLCAIWFVIFGGTAIHMDLAGAGISNSGPPESMLFTLLRNLPYGAVTMALAMVSIVAFFVTSADSACVVMSSMSQRGKPEPSRLITAIWSALLGATAASLLVAGGVAALSGLQSFMVVSALPFALVIFGMMICWSKELRVDPYVLRQLRARCVNTTTGAGDAAPASGDGASPPAVHDTPSTRRPDSVAPDSA